jgi:hypothetical protein
MRGPRAKLTFANVAAAMALFLAIAVGTAYATSGGGHETPPIVTEVQHDAAKVKVADGQFTQALAELKKRIEAGNFDPNEPQTLYDAPTGTWFRVAQSERVSVDRQLELIKRIAAATHGH